MRQKAVIFLIVLVFGIGFAFAEESEPNKTVFSFEQQTEDIVFTYEMKTPKGQALFEQVYDLYGEGEFLTALDKLYELSLVEPEFQHHPDYLLLKAELYYFLGTSNVSIQADIAKPIYSRLLIGYPGNANDPLVAFRLATIFKRQKYYPEAEGMYKFVVDEYPDTSLAQYALLGLATSLHAQERDEETLKVLDLIREAEIHRFYEPFTLVLEAQIAFRMGDSRKALNLFNKAFDRGMIDRDMTTYALFSYAETLTDAGRTKEGYRWYQEVLSRPDSESLRPQCLLGLADYEYVQGEREKAIDRYTNLTVEYGESEAGLMAAIRLGDVRALIVPDTLDPQVIKAYKTVADAFSVSLEVSYIARLRLAGYYLAGRDYLSAMVQASDVYRGRSHRAMKRQALRILIEAFDGFSQVALHENALESLCKVFHDYRTEILEAKPSREITRRILAAHQERLLYDSVPEIAENEFLLQNYPQLMRLFAAKALLSRGDQTRAATLLVSVANSKVMPERVEAMEMLAHLQNENGNTNGAIDMMRKILAEKGIEKPMFARCALTLGNWLVNRAELKTAESWFSKALDTIDPEKGIGDKDMLADGIFGLADVEYRIGNTDVARKLYLAAYAGFPEDVRGALARFRLTRMGQTNLITPVNENGEPVKHPFWDSLISDFEKHLAWIKENLPAKG